MLKIDYWYGHKREDITGVDCWFSDSDCEYRGNIYKENRAIGDYVADDSGDVEREFPGIFDGR